jgi:hypothetical protein
MQTRSETSITIEGMLQAGESVSAIARAMGVSRTRVQQINKRMQAEGCKGVQDLAGVGLQGTTSRNLANVLKTLTIRLTPAVFAALTEACVITNSRDPEDPLTVEDYVNQLIINRVVDLGLLRKPKSR